MEMLANTHQVLSVFNIYLNQVIQSVSGDCEKSGDILQPGK